ncbi:DUF3093 domain-containing protein [uncultured Amnibacterium sp.]|uniref:DUF3093 domain-containing protein n=1 Tax=uncultured Amnibacterium sp. TaxID=1631851 RepID=UPI0035CC578D
MRFRERLTPGIGTLVAVLLLLPAVFIVVLPLDAVAGAVLAVAVTVAAELVLVLTAPVVAVTDGVLTAGRARIAVSFTGATEGFRGPDATQARGPGLDARAFTLFRGWIDPVVRVGLVDPDDPAPYWLVSTRRPEELRAALAAERAAPTT